MSQTFARYRQIGKGRRGVEDAEAVSVNVASIGADLTSYWNLRGRQWLKRLYRSAAAGDITWAKGEVMLDFNSLAQQCAPNVHPTTLQAVVRTESGFDPYAIGVVGGHLVRQPRDRAEAVVTAKALEAQGINFSMGLGQVNRTNLARYGLTYETVFDPCENLRAGSAILHDCYERAAAAMGRGAQALRAAISCYYSGNFTRGGAADADGTSYVQRVVANAQMAAGSTSVVPAIPVVMDRQSDRPAHAAAADAKTAPTHRSGPKERQDVPHPSWDAFGDSACEGDCD